MKKVFLLPTVALSTVIVLTGCSTDEPGYTVQDHANINRAIASVDRSSSEYSDAYHYLEREFGEDDTHSLTPLIAETSLASQGYPDDIIKYVIDDFDDAWKDQATVHAIMYYTFDYANEVDHDSLNSTDPEVISRVTQVEEEIMETLSNDGFTEAQTAYAMIAYSRYVESLGLVQ